MKWYALIIVLAGSAGGAAFCVGRIHAAGPLAPAQAPSQQWLQGVSVEVTQAEVRFEQQVQGWMDRMHAERRTLASMLMNPDATGEQILDQVERVTDARATLTRSVARHLVQLRGRLPDAQGHFLMRSCATCLQGQVRSRYRWRGGARDAGFEDGQSTGRTGRGGWGGNGPHGGYGRQYRGGYNLASRLGLTAEQVQLARQRDPDFENRCGLLADALREVHADVAAGFADAGTSDETLLLRIDGLIEAHRALERLVAQHLVLLRPYLSQQQREQLPAFCGSRTPGAGSSTPG